MSLDALTAIWRAPPCKGGDLLCLLAIADNADEYGYAWPSISTIARKAAMSERGAQKCLRKLEEAGLIQVKLGGGRGSSNSYQITTNGMGVTATYKNPEQSSPNRVHPLPAENPELSRRKGEQNDDKPRTPVHPNPIEPSKEHCAADAPHNELNFDLIFSACPRKGSWEATEVEVLRAVDGGADPLQLLSAAKAYAKEQAGNEARFIKLSENFFADGTWRRYLEAPKQEIDAATVLRARADDILEKKPWVRLMKPSEFGPCITAGLVTPDQCRKAGIQL